MPGPDITRPKSRASNIFLFLRLVFWSAAVVAVLVLPFAGHALWIPSQLQSQAPPAQTDPKQSEQKPATESQPSQSQSGATPAPPPATQQHPPNEQGTFAIRKDAAQV